MGEWISTGERMPHVGNVGSLELLVFNRRYVTTCWYADDLGFYVGEDEDIFPINEDISFWQPLPSPPEE